MFKEDGQGEWLARGPAAARGEATRELTTGLLFLSCTLPALRVRPGAPHAWYVRRRRDPGVWRGHGVRCALVLGRLPWALEP